MASNEVTSVKAMAEVLQGLLQRARDMKPMNEMEPPLLPSDFDDTAFDRFSTPGISQQAQFAAIETAFRDIFYNLLVRLSYNFFMGKDANE